MCCRKNPAEIILSIIAGVFGATLLYIIGMPYFYFIHRMPYASGAILVLIAVILIKSIVNQFTLSFKRKLLLFFFLILYFIFSSVLSFVLTYFSKQEHSIISITGAFFITELVFVGLFPFYLCFIASRILKKNWLTKVNK